MARPVSPAKLDEIRASRRKRFYRSLETNPALAERLVDAQTILGDWGRVVDDLRMAETVTAEEVTEMARGLFREDRAAVVLVEPEGGQP